MEALLAMRKEKLFIINRSFWPIYPVIGEALMQFAEQEAKAGYVGVIMQDHVGIAKKTQESGRGQGVHFFPARAWSVSGSGIARRILDAVFFMFWVFFVLVWQRPTKVYVSTDPPVLVPFIVMLYSKVFGARYIYHLQDIHPEATNVVLPVRPIVFRFFRWLDALTMRHADLLITITEEMAGEIKNRSRTSAPIQVLANPSVAFDGINSTDKQFGFSFCGNAGRLQRIPLLIEAIKKYSSTGGSLPFVFAGAGIYAPELKELAKSHSNVTYKGLISAQEAAQINASYQWALLPIEDEVTRYAFPSKSSSYVYSGAFIAAVCGQQTSVAQWVMNNKLGCVIEPSVNDLVKYFFAVERNEIDITGLDAERAELKARLGFDVFVANLTKLIMREYE